MEFTEEEEKTILKQKNAILKGVPSLDVIRPCRPQDGIVQITDEEKASLKNRFKQLQKSIYFCSLDHSYVDSCQILYPIKCSQR